MEKESEPETPSQPTGANHTTVVSNIEPPTKKNYVFVAYRNEVNLVHPKFEAIWDTGASSHMFNDYIFFKNVKNTAQTQESIMTAGSEELKVEASGEVVLKGVTVEKFTLQNSLYILGLRNNLIAAGALKQKGAVEVANPNDPNKFIIAFDDQTFLRGRYVNNLRVVQIEPVSNILNSHNTENTTDQCNSILDHNRLGHINPIYLKKTLGNEGNKNDNPCDTCQLSKSTKLPFSGTKPYTRNPLDNIHIDLSGIIRTSCIFNYSYFILVVDEYTRMKFIYFLKTKTKEEVFEAINSFILRAERHCDKKVKMITTNGGSEFINSLLTPFCESLGIVKNTTTPYTPQQNGLVERFMQTISTKARALLIQSGVPTRYWSLACDAAVFIQNRVYNRSQNGFPESTYELWYGHKPNLKYIRTFGCLAYIQNRSEERDNKFRQTSRKGFLAGFDEFNRNYLIFDYDSHLFVNTHDVTFDEVTFPEKGDDIDESFIIESEKKANQEDDPETQVVLDSTSSTSTESDIEGSRQTHNPESYSSKAAYQSSRPR
jgi:transposase InsO family protein